MALGYMRENLGLQAIWQVTHNSFLQIGAEVGLIGFVVFILISLQSLLIFLRTSRRQATSAETEEIRILGGLMFLGFTGQLVAAVFLSQGYSIYFVLYFALAAVIRRLQAELPANKM
jgi:O-antigen ligase